MTHIRVPAQRPLALTPRRLRVVAGPKDQEAWRAEVVVAVAMHEQASLLPRCLTSILDQDFPADRLAIVLLDDRSHDDWRHAAGKLLDHPRLFVLEANCGSAARARNAILDFVDDSLREARWIARLDADDRFSTCSSLADAVRRGDQTGARFVVGGNRLVLGGRVLEKTNGVRPELFDPSWIVGRLEQMASGIAENELPSCNLLLAGKAGWRYPDVESAEDHWLVADLLINHRQLGALEADTLYCDYTLGGDVTQINLHAGRYGTARKALFKAAKTWVNVRSLDGKPLGAGQEGVVRYVDGVVEKRFYPDVIGNDVVAWLSKALREVSPYLPEPTWSKVGDSWRLRYAWKATSPVETITVEEASRFLSFCLDRKLVCANVKRENFRRTPGGELIFVDVGNSIVPMNVEYFLDAAARMFAISALGWADAELRRRPATEDDPEALDQLPGFPEFYSRVLTEYARTQWRAGEPLAWPVQTRRDDRVSLCIKACAMDAEVLSAQVTHIVAQLGTPCGFAETLLVLDPYPGPFLRQHALGDSAKLLADAECLRRRGLIDRVLVGPTDPTIISAIHSRWFGIACAESHSIRGIPIAPQLWGFEQVRTRYVLQCDVDVFIGRRDIAHDYLAEMVQAAQEDGVLGVAFNIAHDPSSAVRRYKATVGEFVPEVRCGLIDLHRVNACRPLPNKLLNGRLSLSWYRSLHQHQRREGMRTVRGGDPRTFYVHPPNAWKADGDAVARTRDLVANGTVPPLQYDRWDLEGTCADWAYERRREEIVFLLKGRETPPQRLHRCLQSLAAQDDQDFGIVVVDDASGGLGPWSVPGLLGPLLSRTTLIRNHARRGRIQNMRTAIGEICTDPGTLVAILDLDDALMDRGLVRRLRALRNKGHDVVLAAMFRPDKPLKLYHPGFGAPRANWGAEVWIHLRAFEKRLFDLVPIDALQIRGRWIDECTDYAVMIPVVELCSNPVYIPEYCYFHERSTPNTPEWRARKDAIIRAILAKPTVAGSGPRSDEPPAR